MFRNLQKALVVPVLLAALSCTKIVYEQKEVYVENPIEVPSYPDLQDNKPDTVKFTKADVQFYGAYSQTVDRWYLTLFEKDGVKYVAEDDEYIGQGHVMVLCMQTPISGGKEKDIPVIARHYSSPTSYSDLTIGQFEFGYDFPFDHPYKGIRYATYGTYALNLDEAEYIPRYISDGSFDVKKLDNGEYEVSGMLVDTGFKKHTFIYTGPITGVTEWNYYMHPNSSLKQDITLTQAQLPVLNIRRTDLPFGSSKNIDMVRMYLTDSGVIVGPQASYGTEKLSGSGAVVVLEVIVEHGQTNIPAGTYTVAPSVEGGYDGSYLKPFHFKEGVPNKFTNREGSWYFNLASDGHWSGDYAQLHNGTVTISYAAGKDTPVIHADLVDCNNPSNKITIDWK